MAKSNKKGKGKAEDLKGKKSKKKGGKKLSVREKMLARKEKLKKGGGDYKTIFLKSGETLRARFADVGKDVDPLVEGFEFFLSKELGSMVSPASIGMPCAVMEYYEDLKDSDDPADRTQAAEMKPKEVNYGFFSAVYSDQKGKELDDNKCEKWISLRKGQAQDIVNAFLDEDDWGDYTDAQEGYDFKFGKEGSGKNGTTYTTTPCPKKPVHKKFKGKVYDLDEEFKALLPSYEETQDYLNKFLNGLGSSSDDVEQEEKKEKKDKKKKKKSKK